MSAPHDVATAPPKQHSAVTVTFRTFRGLDGFRSIRSEWTEVLNRIEHPEFFHQYEWYDALLEAWPAVATDTFFVVAYRGNGPIAICPLHLMQTRARGLSLRTLAPPDPNDVAYPDFICNRADLAELFSSLLKELRSHREIAWDVLTLPRIFANDAEIAALARNAGVFSHQRGVCYYYHADEGKDAISTRISSGLRKHLRWCRRQLNAMGNVEFVTARDPQLIPELLDEFLALEASGWKGASGEATAIKLDQSLLRFYGGLMTRFGEDENCEINLLRLNGRSVAGQFCLISGGTWYHLKIAYDEQFDKYSPGSVLLEEVLGRLCEDNRVRIASFLTGAAWAERWHALEVGVYRLIARNHTISGRIALMESKLRRLVRDRLLPFMASLRTKLRRASQ